MSWKPLKTRKVARQRRRNGFTRTVRQTPLRKVATARGAGSFECDAADSGPPHYPE